MAATLAELYKIRFDRDNLQNRVAAAILKQAWPIITEDPATANHPNRVVWARHIIETDLTESAYRAMGWVAKSNQIQNNGAQATDNQVETAVSEALPNLIPAAIPVRPDFSTASAAQVEYVVALEHALGIG